MLERIREGSQGVVAKTVLGLVILTFAVSGIGSYLGSSSDSAVATVNGVEIGQAEFDQAYQDERNQMQRQYGQMFDQLLADEAYLANFKQGVLDRLVVEELQKQQASDLGIRVGDDQIKDLIRQAPQFQTSGAFDNDIFESYLRQNGLTFSKYREWVRQQYSRNQYVGSISATDFVLPNEVSKYQKLNEQTRSFELLSLKVDDLKKQVKFEQADLESYYSLNMTRYMTPEKVAVEYILVNSEELAANLEVTDEEVRQYYEDNQAEFTTPERRRISHILIESGDDAESRVNELEKKVSGGEDFAEIAKANSQDTFSAENGGDLEWLEPGAMDEAFDKAAFALEKVGDVSSVVKTEFGFHLIKLTGLEPEVVKSFDEAKKGIADTIKADKASENYISVQSQVNETAFESPETLDDAADDSGIALKTTKLVARNQLPAEINYPAVVNKVFDEDFITEGLNSELININDSLSVAVRVTEHEAPRQQTLQEVAQLVETAVVKQKAQELAEKVGQDAVAKAKSGEEFSVLSDELGAQYSRHDNLARSSTDVDVAIRNKVFELAKPVEAVSEVDTITLQSGDVAVISLNSIGQVASQDANQQKSALANIINQVTTRALLDASREAADIK